MSDYIYTQYAHIIYQETTLVLLICTLFLLKYTLSYTPVNFGFESIVLSFCSHLAPFEDKKIGLYFQNQS